MAWRGKETDMAADLIRWKAQYKLGLDEIDAQHESLLDLINAAWQAIIRRSDPSVALALIESLEKYSRAHFAAEENFMAVTGYPGADGHKREHRAFMVRIGEEKERAIASGDPSLDLMHRLRDALIDHIVVSDKAYAAYTQASPYHDNALVSRFFRQLF